MQSTFRTFLIWLMMLVIPVQGFAAASVVVCEPVVAMSNAAPVAQHDHAHMQAAEHQHSADANIDNATNASDSNQSATPHHVAGKCGFCTTCCVSAAISAPAALTLPTVHVGSERIVTFESFPSSIVPAYPDRPPQATFA